MTTAAEAKVHVVNGALVQHLGLPASYTIDAETELGGTVDLVWPAIAARVVTTYDFPDCRKLFKPTQLAGTPDNGWTYGFAMPGERIGAPLAVLDQAGASERKLRDFLLEGGNIYTNITPIWVRCRVLLDPQYWDQGFAMCFRAALAGGLASALLSDADLAAQLTQDAFGKASENFSGGLFGKLIAVSKGAEQPGRGFMDNDSLTSARFM